MAVICLVGPADAPVPEAWELLSHALERADTLEECRVEGCDAIVVDCRREPTRARRDCLELAAREVGVPVVLLAGDQTMAVVSPEWGVDDFIAESAGPAEVEARLRFLLRHRRDALVVAGPFSVDEQAYTASAGGRDLDLTYTEFELFKYLVAHAGRVLTRDVLLSQVWGYDYYGGTRTVDVHIRRLRAKVGPEFEGHIQTVRSVGYRLTAAR